MKTLFVNNFINVNNTNVKSYNYDSTSNTTVCSYEPDYALAASLCGNKEHEDIIKS